ncbi:MAG: kynureninase [Ilumatobacteraceae bacterium]
MSFAEARERAHELDAADSLASMRGHFDIPDGTLYFDGNSLGPLTFASREVLNRTIEFEWRERLIRSWNEDWLAMPARVGNMIAPLIGAAPNTVIAADNTSINLSKALHAAVALRPGRTEIVIDINNFPTDIYIAQSVADQRGLTLKAVPAADIISTISSSTAVVTATHVDYRSAHILNAASITQAAHDNGALMVWDLAHTAGAVPINLTSLDADFAVGCGYKYLNGGPGAPAFIYAAPRLLEEAGQPLQGWWGHADPFEFEVNYRPARGISRFLTGTANVLSMKSLEAAMGVFSYVSMADLRAKSMGLTSFFVDLFDQKLAARGFTLASPRGAESRGSHVALGFAGGKALVESMASQGLIADFRPPDLMRFGFAPLYNSYGDVVKLAEHLANH